MTEDHALLSDVGLNSTRRRVLLASLLSVLPLGLSGGRAEAINSSETQVTVPDQVKWTAWPAGPPHGAEMATLFGRLVSATSDSTPSVARSIHFGIFNSLKMAFRLPAAP
jgi:hypothetical protein